MNCYFGLITHSFDSLDRLNNSAMLRASTLRLPGIDKTRLGANSSQLSPPSSTLSMVPEWERLARQMQERYQFNKKKHPFKKHSSFMGKKPDLVCLVSAILLKPTKARN